MRVFVDSNVAIYAADASHPRKDPCVRFLARAHAGEIHAVTSTEVLQEILHRYHRLGRPDTATQVYALWCNCAPKCCRSRSPLPMPVST